MELPNDDYKSYKLSVGEHTLQVVDDKASGEESNICCFEVESEKGYWIESDINIAFLYRLHVGMNHSIYL